MKLHRVILATSAAVWVFSGGAALAQQGNNGPGGPGGPGAQGTPGGPPSGLVRPIPPRPPVQPVQPPAWQKFPTTGLGGVTPQFPPAIGQSGSMLYRRNPNTKLPAPYVTPPVYYPPRPSGPCVYPTPYPYGSAGHGYGAPVSTTGSGTAVSIGSGGLNVTGVYAGDNGRVAFHLGSGYGIQCVPKPPGWCDGNWNGNGCWPANSWRWWWCNNGWWNNSWYPYSWNYWPQSYSYSYYDPYAYVYGPQAQYIDPFVQYGMSIAQQQAAQQQQANAPRELTVLERADMALKYGYTDDAISLYREYLSVNPDDADASRMLSMALLDERKVQQAVAVLIMAYQKQPKLAMTPIDDDAMYGGDVKNRARFNALMTYANNAKTSSGYFAACVMAQCEGRFDLARKLLDKAAAAGLDKGVVGAMKAALANR